MLGHVPAVGSSLMDAHMLRRHAAGSAAEQLQFALFALCLGHLAAAAPALGEALVVLGSVGVLRCVYQAALPVARWSELHWPFWVALGCSAAMLCRFAALFCCALYRLLRCRCRAALGAGARHLQPERALLVARVLWLGCCVDGVLRVGEAGGRWLDAALWLLPLASAQALVCSAAASAAHRALTGARSPLLFDLPRLPWPRAAAPLLGACALALLAGPLQRGHGLLAAALAPLGLSVWSLAGGALLFFCPQAVLLALLRAA